MERYDYNYKGLESYCYPGTDILKNKLGIKDDDALTIAEREITSLKLLMRRRRERLYVRKMERRHGWQSARGRPVPMGTYLVRGVIKTADGRREKVQGELCSPMVFLRFRLHTGNGGGNEPNACTPVNSQKILILMFYTVSKVPKK